MWGRVLRVLFVKEAGEEEGPDSGLCGMHAYCGLQCIEHSVNYSRHGCVVATGQRLMPGRWSRGEGRRAGCTVVLFFAVLSRGRWQIMG